MELEEAWNRMFEEQHHYDEESLMNHVHQNTKNFRSGIPEKMVCMHNNKVCKGNRCPMFTYSEVENYEETMAAWKCSMGQTDEWLSCTLEQLKLFEM
jgi:hypothetical protein